MHLDHYLQLAQPWLDHYGYAALFLLVFIEGFGIPAPGQSLIIAAAWLSQQGQFHLPTVLLLAWLAAVAGDNLGYWLGRWGGSRLLLRLGASRAHLLKTRRVFHHYGGAVVVAARFFEVLRQLNGVVAGSLNMPWWEPPDL